MTYQADRENCRRLKRRVGPGARSQEPGARSQEPGARSQKPGARSQEPEARSQELGARSKERVRWYRMIPCWNFKIKNKC